MSPLSPLPHSLDLVCCLCEPRDRRVFQSPDELVAHLLQKHKDHPHDRWPMNPLLPSDLVCYLCEPRHRRDFQSPVELLAHWQQKHKDHPHRRWQKAVLWDKMFGFDWRPHLPEVGAWSDGLCPTCHEADGESSVFLTGEKAWHGGEKMILVVYCRRDGDIIRRISC